MFGIMNQVVALLTMGLSLGERAGIVRIRDKQERRGSRKCIHSISTDQIESSLN